ncbi:hypothetical protein RND71_034623 [Anisodus tanguticus]|uniref:Uncharacterized protein n=1 Tax=Anisodus tanguticus TaxID=243964 RepID=A0AAE1R9W4_9SOLA|nr:hypothetical protein RND71_034623 [Anisodus tanguticus]
MSPRARGRDVRARRRARAPDVRRPMRRARGRRPSRLASPRAPCRHAVASRRRAARHAGRPSPMLLPAMPDVRRLCRRPPPPAGRPRPYVAAARAAAAVTSDAGRPLPRPASHYESALHRTSRKTSTYETSLVSRPLPRVGKRTAGACVASSPDSDLEAFTIIQRHGSFAHIGFSTKRDDQLCESTGKTNPSHDGLNPNVPYWWVNNPTLGEFSLHNDRKSRHRRIKKQRRYERLAPQAAIPVVTFLDTSSFEFRRSKGSLGHAFTVRIRTGNRIKRAFTLLVPHEISRSR